MIREVAHLSIEYWKTVDLRSEVLRIPLGLKFTDEELQAENDQIHIAYFEGEDVIGCLCLKSISETEIKMRQVAVSEQFHGKGIGSRLVDYSEHYAKGKGFNLMSLHARNNAIPFYKKKGYTIDGAPFLEVGIEHFK
ncbi:MAG: GNAT family N-acetyltransferase, partial [Bacteroidetes bacterium]|nr:GNAT family N-acetyltransferase [Bacteroidota bacterium]